ncbi:hypothetical protein TEA_019636 [Camellia sinensis var. sinensis]|uniref:peroxidase n=1 Tax=Camellia sinensis var. sinensis TaxID=542762 RepID=A0A4S4DM13_CAMSN|nr:hypothetical protein TEA_019636 [Camellia sinensis var. sinensis]
MNSKSNSKATVMFNERDVVDTVRVRVPPNSSSSSSPCARDCCYTKFLLQNHLNFKRSASPTKIMRYEDGSWVDFAPEVVDSLRSGFMEGKSVVEVRIEGIRCFLAVLKLDQKTLWKAACETHAPSDTINDFHALPSALSAFFTRTPGAEPCATPLAEPCAVPCAEPLAEPRRFSSAAWLAWLLALLGPLACDILLSYECVTLFAMVVHKIVQAVVMLRIWWIPYILIARGADKAYVWNLELRKLWSCCAYGGFHCRYLSQEGYDASILLVSTGSMLSEKRSNPNRDSVHGFEVIDEIKFALEKECPHTVSYADILALPARDSTSLLFIIASVFELYNVLTSGPSWEVPFGRRDSKGASLSGSNNNIPAPNNTFQTILTKFKLQGLDIVDLVACPVGNGLADFTLDQSYAAQLRTRCPKFGSDQNLFFLDFVTLTEFDNNYFKNLFASKGLLSSDRVLVTEPTINGVGEEICRELRAFLQAICQVHDHDGEHLFPDRAKRRDSKALQKNKLLIKTILACLIGRIKLWD